jgi:hypothetical protein
VVYRSASAERYELDAVAKEKAVDLVADLGGVDTAPGGQTGGVALAFDGRGWRLLIGLDLS